MPSTKPQLQKSIKQLCREILPLLGSAPERQLLMLYGSVARNATGKFRISRLYIDVHMDLSHETVRLVNALFTEWNILSCTKSCYNGSLTLPRYEYTFNRPRLEELATQGNQLYKLIRTSPIYREWTPEGKVSLNVLRLALRECRTKSNTVIHEHLEKASATYACSRFDDTYCNLSTDLLQSEQDLVQSEREPSASQSCTEVVVKEVVVSKEVVLEDENPSSTFFTEKENKKALPSDIDCGNPPASAAASAPSSSYIGIRISDLRREIALFGSEERRLRHGEIEYRESYIAQLKELEAQLKSSAGVLAGAQ